MSLISNVLEAAYCNGTHHKLAFHSLNYLQCPEAEKWRKLFLFHQDHYLKGSKDPDKVFKDFKNHVLHVQSGNWGGAPAEAEMWYQRTVDHLREGNWPNAVYAAGILSHYVTDPVMPFHTAQSEAESNVHRAVEWSISKSYDSLRGQIDAASASADISADDSESWLGNLIIEAAQFSNQSYDLLIEQYDFKVGAKDPPAGLNETCREHIARLLGYARVLHARILERAIVEAAVEPPEVNLSLESVVAAIKIPMVWVTRKMTDAGEKKIVQAMYQEFEETGKVDRNLTDDVRVVRDLVYSRSVSPAREKKQPEVAHHSDKTTDSDKITDSAKITEMPKPSQERKRGLQMDSDLVAAPSIGKKTAAVLSVAGLHTVGDLLNADPDTVAKATDRRYITPQAIRDWQDQARLAQKLPQLRGHDVQILVGGGIRSLSELAAARPEAILKEVTPFVQSEAGKRVVRPGNEPDLDEVEQWVEWAESA